MSASQLTQAKWMVAGWVILIPFCLAHSWEPTTSTINPFSRPPRPISQWKTRWPKVTAFLNAKFCNREDGCSGAEALIWAQVYDVKTDTLGPERVPYMPDAAKPAWLSQWLWAAWRAYCWSAWRNSTNELSR